MSRDLVFRSVSDGPKSRVPKSPTLVSQLDRLKRPRSLHKPSKNSFNHLKSRKDNILIQEVKDRPTVGSQRESRIFGEGKEQCTGVGRGSVVVCLGEYSLGSTKFKETEGHRD